MTKEQDFTLLNALLASGGDRTMARGTALRALPDVPLAEDFEDPVTQPNSEDGENDGESDSGAPNLIDQEEMRAQALRAELLKRQTLNERPGNRR